MLTLAEVGRTGLNPKSDAKLRRCFEAKAAPVVNQLLKMLDSASQQLRLVCGLFGEEVKVWFELCESVNYCTATCARARTQRQTFIGRIGMYTCPHERERERQSKIVS